MKEVFIGLCCCLLVVGIALGLDYTIGLKWFGFIEPQKENVRREIFKNTRSYNEAQMQNLIKYMHEYRMADKEGKEIIASTIRQMYAEYDENKLPIEMRNFLKKIKYGE